jgi:hypothetical protein
VDELVLRQEALIVCVDEVVENLALRALSNTNELSELLMLEPRETFGDVPRRRSSRIIELVAELEPFGNLRPREKIIRK